MMRTRIVLCALCMVLAGGAVLNATDLGPQYLVRVDLSKRAHFDQVVALNWQPVFRWGNEFYFVLAASDIGQLDILGVANTVIDEHPFRNGDYLITSPVKPTPMTGLVELTAERVDRLGEASVWKPLTYAVASPSDIADGPRRITGATIPLVYLDAMPMALTAALADTLLDTIAARISVDSIIAYDTYLMNLQTRYVYTYENDLAEAYIRQKFLSFGYTDVDIDTVDVFGWIGHNVICTKTGLVEPDKVIIVGGHYDSYNTQSDPMVFAPGADDNGSGTVAVMEIARALADLPTNKTIIFIAFDAEEVGLVGSEYFATRAYNNGMDIELMINMDMIGYDPNNTNLTILGTEPVSEAYAALAADLSIAHTGVTGIVDVSPGGSSDHVPFSDLGYRVLYAQEYTFNTPGWHTDIDIISRMDMPYLTDIARVSGLTAYAVSVSPAPVEGLALWDFGDGDRLRVDWTPSSSPNITGYTVMVGTGPGSYSDTSFVPGASSSSFEITGLAEGVQYWVAMTAVNEDGWTSIVAPEATLTPLSQPRMPASVFADVELGRLELSWGSSVELDFDHYVLNRGLDSLSLQEYVNPLYTNSYSDIAVSGGTRYYYSVVAVDDDMNESAASAIVSGIPATFDQGILIFDLTTTGTGNPTDQQQWDVYNAMFAGYQHGYYKYDDYNVPVDKSELGQYEAVFWIDDDYRRERWLPDHFAKLDWYTSYGNGVVLTGWLTAQELLSSDLLHDDLNCSGATRIDAADCVGGIGEEGFPGIILDTAKLAAAGYSFWGGKIGYVWTLVPADATAQVIYRYNSATDNPANEASAVAIRRDIGFGKLAFLSLPLYYVRHADAVAMIITFADWLGQEPAGPGDLYVDGVVDILDVVLLIDVIFAGAAPATSYPHCDVNGDCTVNVLDAVLLIDYVFRGGPAPVLGCA